MSSSLDYVTTPAVFRHVKRADWGLGRVVSEGPERRDLQFEDGQRRTIKRGFYHLLERVDQPDEESKKTLDALVDQAREDMGARVSRRQRKPPAVAPGVAFDEQIIAFRQLFADGFQSDAWKKDVRGIEAGRVMKRHREFVAVEGPKILGTEALRARLEAGEGLKAYEEMLALLKKTDLAVVKTDIKPLEGLNDTDRGHFMQAFLQMAETPEASPRVDDFLSTLQRAGVKPTWTLLSAIMTMSDPARCGPVRSSLLRTQAKRLNIELKLSSPPNGRGFVGAQEVLQQVTNRLVNEGFQPADRIDVSEMVARTISALSSR